MLHDAVYLYLLVVDKILKENGDYRNGSVVYDFAKGIRFEGKLATRLSIQYLVQANNKESTKASPHKDPVMHRRRFHSMMS